MVSHNSENIKILCDTVHEIDGELNILTPGDISTHGSGGEGGVDGGNEGMYSIAYI